MMVVCCFQCPIEVRNSLLRFAYGNQNRPHRIQPLLHSLILATFLILLQLPPVVLLSILECFKLFQVLINIQTIAYMTLFSRSKQLACNHLRLFMLFENLDLDLTLHQ